MKVSEGRDDDEYIVTRFNHTVPPINIVNIYGTQESRTTDSDIEKSWLRLMKDVKDIETRSEAVLIIGDMNRAIGDGEYGVKGNNLNVTPGGKLIHNLLKTEKYILLNASEKCSGGPLQDLIQVKQLFLKT